MKRTPGTQGAWWLADVVGQPIHGVTGASWVSSPCVAGPNWFQGIRWRGDHGEICEMHPFPAFFITYTDERNKIQKIYYPLILLEEANQISLWYN